MTLPDVVPPAGFEFERVRDYCGSCKYCERLKGDALGFCRRYAPRAYVNVNDPHGRAFAAFPIVRTSNDWCGEHVELNIPRI